MKVVIKCFFFILILTSCNPIINNTPENVETVFAMTDFDIEIQNWGCFGGSTENFKVVKTDQGHILKSRSTGKSHIVTQSKMDSLKNFLKTRVGKFGNGGCTSSEYIRLGALLNSVNYSHSFCSNPEGTMINDMLNYIALVSAEGSLE